MLFQDFLQICKVNFALRSVFHGHNLESSQLGRGGVSAVGRKGNQTNVSVTLVIGLLIGTNGDEAAVLALGS